MNLSLRRFSLMSQQVRRAFIYLSSEACVRAQLLQNRDPSKKALGGATKWAQRFFNYRVADRACIVIKSSPLSFLPFRLTAFATAGQADEGIRLRCFHLPTVQ